MATGAGRQVCSEAKCTEVMLWGAHGWDLHWWDPREAETWSQTQWAELGKGRPQSFLSLPGSWASSSGFSALAAAATPVSQDLFLRFFFWAFKAFAPGLPTPPTRHVLFLLLQPWKP